MAKPRIQIINFFLKKSNNKIYLEIGVEKGFNFFRVKAKSKIDVDPNFVISTITKLKHISNSFFNYKLFPKTSDDFFKEEYNCEMSIESKEMNLSYNN